MDSFVDYMLKGGPAAIFAGLWWLERNERIATQKALLALSVDGLKSMDAMKNAVRDLRFTLFRRAHADAEEQDE